MVWDIASNTMLSEGVGDSENSDILVYVIERDACLDFEGSPGESALSKETKERLNEAKQSTQIHKQTFITLADTIIVYQIKDTSPADSHDIHWSKCLSVSQQTILSLYLSVVLATVGSETFFRLSAFFNDDTHPTVSSAAIRLGPGDMKRLDIFEAEKESHTKLYLIAAFGINPRPD
jgi:hypothetical protein